MFCVTLFSKDFSFMLSRLRLKLQRSYGMTLILSKIRAE